MAMETERIVLLKAAGVNSNDAPAIAQEQLQPKLDASSCHMCCAFVTLLVIASVSFLLCAQLLHWREITRIASYVLFGLTYVVYLAESFNAGTLGYLKNFNPNENLVAHIERIRSNPLKIKFHCLCFYEETETRTVTETYRDAFGHESTRKHEEEDTDDVITYRGEEEFLFDSWEDLSPGLSSYVMHHPVVRIDFSHVLTFADTYSENYFRSEWEAFKEENRPRDTLFRAWQTREIKDFLPRMFSLIAGNKTPWFLRTHVVVLTTIFLLSWPYRLFVDRHTAKCTFEFQKCIRKIPV